MKRLDDGGGVWCEEAEEENEEDDDHFIQAKLCIMYMRNVFSIVYHLILSLSYVNLLKRSLTQTKPVTC